MLSNLKIFKSGLFAYMNKVSYRVYLIHPIILVLFDKYTLIRIACGSPALFNIPRYFTVVSVSFAAAILIEKIKEAVSILTKKLTA